MAPAPAAAPQRPVTIAFDVMGSDHGHVEIIRGAAQLTLETPHIHALLGGDAQLSSNLACAGQLWFATLFW